MSGGMDSTAALYWAIAQEGPGVVGLFFHYGSKHNDMEYLSAEYHSKKTGIALEKISLGFINRLYRSDLLISGGNVPEGHYASPSMRSTVVPFRNGIMLSIAAGYAESVGADTIVIANHYGDHAIYPDCRKDFITPMSLAVTKGTAMRVHVLSPFVDDTKDGILDRTRHSGIDWGHTWSCYKGLAKHCGKCGACVERREAFEKAGIMDPTEYEK